MITAYLVGDQQLLKRLQALPGAVNSGLVSGITQLGIDLQRTLRQNNLGGRVPTGDARSLMSKTDFRIEQSGGTTAASIHLHNVAQKSGLRGGTNLRASLRRQRDAFASPTAVRMIRARAADVAASLPEPSFLRSALDSLTPAVRDSIDTTMAQVMS
jgi:hypothetical protein